MITQSEYFKDKDILITGGCGSIGSELVAKLLTFDVKKVKVFDNSESKLFKLKERFNGDERVRTLVGDIRDKERVELAIRDSNIVFHTAALKHVPLCEYNPFEAVQTNVYGTQILINASINANVEKFILISTDKAVNPINTMGATKLLSEKLILNPPVSQSDKITFSCVRFGNVLNSDGSVIPTFKHQLEEEEYLTVTSEDMTRFFMTVGQSVEMIFNATLMAKGKDVFIPKMRALRIIDLAEVMISNANKKKKIKILLIGIRIGEKKSEVLMTKEEAKIAIVDDDMFILKYDAIPSLNKIPINEYDSGRAKLLTKTEIKKLLSPIC